MGVRYLQTLMQKYVPNGYIDVSIIDECVKYYQENKQKPILVIDLMGLINVLTENKKEMLCSGRNQKYKETLDDLFQNIKKVADLIFFEDGPLVSSKLSTWMNRQNQKYEKTVAVLDYIYRGHSLTEITDQIYELPRCTTHLTIVEEVSLKYGELIVTVNRECDAEIAQYATNNPRVIAVLADDTDFLIFPGKWKYYSLMSLNLQNLQTKEYSKSALREYLNLSDEKLVILSTISGNDIIKFEEVENFHKSLIGLRQYHDKRFFALANYIDSLPTRRNDIIQKIAREVLRNKNSSTLKRIEESLDLYKTDFKLEELVDPLLKYCHKQNYTFVFAVLKRKPKNFTIVYYDLRKKDFPNLHDITMRLFQKQIGIILKHQQQTSNTPIQYEIVSKLSHNNIYRQLYVSPEYPIDDVPPLIKLLKRGDFADLDNNRFKLLKWMINEDKLKDFDLTKIPKNYFLDVMVLCFMTTQNFIKAFEADIILLTIKHVETNIVPEDIQCPEYLNERAFRIAFLFTKFHMMIERCLELTGLKNITKLLNFDGVLFHTTYLKYLSSPFDIPQLLCDLQDCRKAYI